MVQTDRFAKSISELSPADKKWIFGNETDNPLRYSFDTKRVMHPGVNGGRLPKEKWLIMWNMIMNQSGERTKRVAYIHIPFCQTKCLFCGFFQNHSNKELEDYYIDKLVAELKMTAKSPFISSHPFLAVYIGGGTPSALSKKNIDRLLNAIYECLPLANDCEVTFEARIYDFDDAKVDACIEGGVTRFSIGVQSFNEKTRWSIGRISKREKVLERIQYIQSLDQSPVIIDLMYGLPYQTVEVLEDDVLTMIRSGIDGGDLYQLNIHKDGGLENAIGKGALPAAARTSEQAIMFEEGVKLMRKNRFKRLSICHWAYGTRERNLYNALTKLGAVLIPFGAGAGGSINGNMFLLERDIYGYMQRIEKSEKPIMFIMSPPEDYELYNYIIGHMDMGELNLSRIKAKHEIDLEESLSPLFNEWVRKGLIEINGDYLDMTIAGQFWYVNLTQAILDCLVMLKRQNNHSLKFETIAGQG